MNSIKSHIVYPKPAQANRDTWKRLGDVAEQVVKNMQRNTKT